MKPFIRILVTVAATVFLMPAQAQVTPPPPDKEPLQVYPNPSAGKFTITVRAQDDLYDVNIYNLMGEMIFHWESANAGAASFDTDLSRHPDGVYFVELDTDQANVVKRIVLER